MTGALDTKARATALALIARFGKSVSWLSTTVTYTIATGKAGTGSTTYSATVSPPESFDLSMVDGTTILASDLRVMIAASGLAFTPKIGDRITMDSVTYRVQNITPIYSGELVAAYEAQCRK